jgi:hypothetical protein
MSEPIVEAQVSGEVVSEIVLRLEDALGDCDRAPALISLLSLALIIMHPSIGPEELTNGVRDTSKFMCLLHDPTAPLELTETERQRMN